MEDDLLRCHRVIYTNLSSYTSIKQILGLPLLRVREVTIQELKGRSCSKRIKEETLKEDVGNGYKIYLHETGDPETEFLVVGNGIHMT